MKQIFAHMTALPYWTKNR